MGLEKAQKPLGILLYSLAGLGGLLGALALLTVATSIDRNAASGDFTGASLLMAFILVAILPLTLAALILALWVDPPRRKRGQAGEPESGQELAATTRPPASKPRPALAAGLLVTATAVTLLVAVALANALRAAHQHGGTHGRELVRAGRQSRPWPR